MNEIESNHVRHVRGVRGRRRAAFSTFGVRISGTHALARRARSRSLRYLSPPRRQFPLRSKIQIDRIMGIREGRRDIDKRRGGAAWENVTRHDFLPLEIETSFLMIREEDSPALASLNPIDGLDVTKYTAACRGSLRYPVAALSHFRSQISRCQINVICRQVAAPLSP